MNTLINCRFCGSEHVTTTSRHIGQQQALCFDCGAKGPEAEDKQAAITAWNVPLRPFQYPNLCANGHQEVGFDGKCPLCKIVNVLVDETIDKIETLDADREGGAA